MSYNQDVKTFITRAELRANIIKNAKNEKTYELVRSREHIQSPAIQHIKNKENEKDPMYDIKKDPNIILAIKNDPCVISLILSCRKNYKQESKIFIENGGEFITIIIKKAASYPMIVLRIPVDNGNLFARPTQYCFNFPLDKLASKDFRLTKSMSYILSLSSNKDNENYTITVATYSKENKKEKETQISNIQASEFDIISLLMSDNYISGLDLTTDLYKTRFLAASVYMLYKDKSNKSDLHFDYKYEDMARFEVNEKELVLKTNVDSNDNSYAIVFRDECELYPSVLIGKTLYIIPFLPYLKNDYLKANWQTNSMYYVIMSYSDGKNQQYLFMKLITSAKLEKDISSSSFINFGSLVSDNYYMCESFTLSESRPKKE